MSDENMGRAMMPGTTLRGEHSLYRVERVLGSGGFGITYLVSTSIDLGGLTVKAHFALKEHFPKDFCERKGDGTLSCMESSRKRVESTKRDFLSEARRLKQVAELASAGNVVRVREVFEANNTAYYVMEYLEGPTLAKYIERHGVLSETEALTLMKPIINTVGVLHENLLTHLDIKPANIILATSDDGTLRPMLIDFGLSKHYDSEGNATSTLNTIGCTPGYAPIEQYTGLKKFSPQSDVYALAATLMHLLTGRTPAVADEISPEIIAGELASYASQKTIAAIINAMRYDRNERTPSAEAFLQALGIDAPSFGEALKAEETLSLHDDPTVFVSASTDLIEGDTEHDNRYKRGVLTEKLPKDLVDKEPDRQKVKTEEKQSPSQSKLWRKIWIGLGVFALLMPWPWCGGRVLLHYIFGNIVVFDIVPIYCLIMISVAGIVRSTRYAKNVMNFTLVLLCGAFIIGLREHEVGHLIFSIDLYTCLAGVVTMIPLSIVATYVVARCYTEKVFYILGPFWGFVAFGYLLMYERLGVYTDNSMPSFLGEMIVLLAATALIDRFAGEKTKNIIILIAGILGIFASRFWGYLGISYDGWIYNM